MAAPPALSESSGYLRVRCNGGLNQQRSAVCILFFAVNFITPFYSWVDLMGNKYVPSIIALLLWCKTTRKKKRKGKNEQNDFI